MKKKRYFSTILLKNGVFRALRRLRPDRLAHFTNKTLLHQQKGLVVYMNNELRAHVIMLLETYSKREQKIAALRYELAHPSHVFSDELIEAMALGHDNDTGRPSSHVSDKTMYIALNYQEKANKINACITDDIASQLVELEQTQSRLKYYVSLLEKRQAEVIRLSYFERVSQENTAKALELSVRTIQKIKTQAIEALTGLYKLAVKIH